MRSFYQFITFAFLQILLWSSNGAEAVQAKTRKKTTDARVGVELDRGLALAGPEPLRADAPSTTAKSEERIVFMAHWKVGRTIPDLELVQIAMDGYMDMITNAEQYGVGRKNLPGAITVFHYNHEIIIASSQKGGQALTYTRDPIIYKLVQQCISSKEKSYDGKCGEMNAAQLYQRLHPNIPINTANIVTVSVRGKKDNPKNTDDKWLRQDGILVPCNMEGGGGCNEIIGPGKVIAREVPEAIWDKTRTTRVDYSKAGWVQTDMDKLSFILPGEQVALD